MASPFATTQASSLTLDHAVNSLLAPFVRRALESWAGSTSVLHTWPLIPWVVDAIGPTSSSAPNEEFRPTKPKKAALFILSSFSHNTLLCVSILLLPYFSCF